MVRLKVVLVGVYFAGMVMTNLAGPVAAGERVVSIHARGSNTLLALTREVAEAFMEENVDTIIALDGGSTAQGVKAVIDGTVDLAMTASEIDSESAADAAAKGISLNRFVVGYTAIVPIVHPDNPVSSLTLLQLRKIFTGKITNWKEVGGFDLPIVPIAHVPESGTQATWIERVLGAQSVMTPKAIVLHIAPTVERVSRERGSISYVFRHSAGAAVRQLAINGVEPTTRMIEQGRYPLLQELAFVGQQEAMIKADAFMRYFLEPERGQAIVRKKGLYPPLTQGGQKP